VHFRATFNLPIEFSQANCICNCSGKPKKKTSKNVEKHTTSTAERLEKTKGNTGHNLLAIDLGRGLVAPDTKPVLRLDIMCEAFK